MTEQELTKKRFQELSHRAYEKGIPTYTNFLNLEEASILASGFYDCEYKLYGGYDNAERCVACFCEYEADFPIDCIIIKPAQQKFADKLSHRDFLGSLMNLGIEREMLGDIKIKDNVGYLFCLNKISQYIIDSLTRVKHTTVKCEIATELPELLNQLPDEEEYIVSSLRVDTVISTIFKTSRNHASQLINQENVFINSKIVYKDAVLLKESDLVSVRGYGRFIFTKAINETKKHKLVIGVRVFR